MENKPAFDEDFVYPKFEKSMIKTHTILIPSMLDIHMALFESVLIQSGYNVEIMKNQGPEVVEEGLKYVHNDTCYPALLVIGESISHLNKKFPVKVLNQWTYHSRLYSAAKYCTHERDMNLVQLVSFGCGLDAVTTDECKLILESKGKIYTQIKIDEITNLGAVKIRLRSLFAALEQEENNSGK